MNEFMDEIINRSRKEKRSTFVGEKAISCVFVSFFSMGNLGHLTWTRLLQLQEQCNPVVPVCAVFSVCPNNGMQMLMHVTEHKGFQGHKVPPNPTGMGSIFMCPEQTVFGFAIFSCVQTTVCDCTDVNGTQGF